MALLQHIIQPTHNIGCIIFYINLLLLNPSLLTLPKYTIFHSFKNILLILYIDDIHPSLSTCVFVKQSVAYKKIPILLGSISTSILLISFVKFFILPGRVDYQACLESVFQFDLLLLTK